jgi:hypothetical protein
MADAFKAQLHANLAAFQRAFSSFSVTAPLRAADRASHLDRYVAERTCQTIWARRSPG